MKMRIYLIAVLLIVSGTTAALAKTWNVGPSRQYQTPTAVMALVATGDTVEIDPGVYAKDVGVWNADSLVLRCRVGFAHLDAQGSAAQRKAIWVINGKHNYVEGIEFSGCAVSDADGSNGAGIRLQSTSFECRRCYFHDNQEGILTGNDTTTEVVIEACEFDHNGVETGGNAGFQHNIYIGHSRMARVAFCYFHRSIVGHELKCRANKSYILFNHIVDEDGDGSLSIDLPNGGLAYVIGNSVEKGPNTANSKVLGYGEEGIINPDSELYFINNTIVTDRQPTTFSIVGTGVRPKFANNIFAGPMHSPLDGFSDTSGNLFCVDTGFFQFRDARHYDYRLMNELGTSIRPLDPGSAHGFALLPSQAYVHPLDSMAWDATVPFFGAFRFIEPAKVNAALTSEAGLYPNPFSRAAQIQLPHTLTNATLTVIDALGHARVFAVDPNSDVVRLERADLAAGLYQYILASSGFTARGRFVIAP